MGAESEDETTYGVFEDEVEEHSTPQYMDTISRRLTPGERSVPIK